MTIAGCPDPRYEVLTAPDAVHGWSTVRLPYAPAGPMRAYRDHLRHALRALAPRPGCGLVATYAAPDWSFADVENVALYNVGSGCYGHLTASGLVCGRADSFDGLHHLTYRLAPLPPPWPWAARRLACIPAANPAPLPAALGDATAWWKAVRTHLQPGEDITGPFHGWFVIDVQLSGAWAGKASQPRRRTCSTA